MIGRKQWLGRVRGDVAVVSGEGGNGALRALLGEAELSNSALGRAVVAAGAEEGVHVGTNTTSVQRMLLGTQPRWPVPRLVAKVLSRALHREVSVSDCGFADRTPASEDRYDGLRCSATLEGTVRTVVELSGRDMRRRRFLLGSVFNAGAFAEPALFALTVPPPPAHSTARDTCHCRAVSQRGGPCTSDHAAGPYRKGLRSPGHLR